MQRAVGCHCRVIGGARRGACTVRVENHDGVQFGIETLDARQQYIE